MLANRRRRGPQDRQACRSILSMIFSLARAVEYFRLVHAGNADSGKCPF